MSFLIIHNGTLVHSGNSFRRNHTKTGSYNHFRICRFGMFFPLSYESNSLADYLDQGISALVMPKNTGLKGILITTKNRLVEVVVVRDENGEYDASCTIIPAEQTMTYYMGFSPEITSRLTVAMLEKDPIDAALKVVRSIFDAKFKTAEFMEFKKFLVHITTDKKNVFNYAFENFRNPDYKP